MNFGIVVAAGKSERMGSNVDKAFLSLGTKPVLAYALSAFERCDDIDGIVLVVKREKLRAATAMAEMFGFSKLKQVVAGGAKRQISVSYGLDALPDDVKIVAVHDGARPCVTPELISETIKTAKRYGSGVAGVRITDTVKYVEKGVTVSRTVDRTKMWAVQTPQTFKIDVLRRAFDAIRSKGVTVTDEASAVELTSESVRLVPASVSNIKITTAEDLALAGRLLNI